MYVSNRKESSNKLIIQTEKHTEPMETQNIKQLEICPKKDWAIKVTVSRKWRRIPINNQTIGLNLILIDQTDRIHSWINSTLMHRLEDKFVENYTLLLSNFIVKKYIKSENFKCFKAEHYICLTPFTTVSVLEPVLPGAYPHLFDCVAFSTFPEHVRQRKYLIDVVGIVESVKPIYHVMNRSAFRKDFIRFVVRDLHNATAHVVFENGLAHAFNVAMMEANEKPAVVIIASCRIRMLGASPNISQLAPTRFYLNPKHPAAEEIRRAIET